MPGPPSTAGRPSCQVPGRRSRRRGGPPATSCHGYPPGSGGDRPATRGAPAACSGLAAAGYFTLPIAIGLLLEHWFVDTRRQLIRRIWQFHLGYLVLAIGAAGLGWINLSSSFPVFDVLLVVNLTLLLAIIAPRLRQLGPGQRAILATHALFGLLLLVDMAVAHGLLTWTRVPVSAGALAFTLAIAGISLADYARTQQALKRLNQRLEQEVAERTAQLQRLVKRLEIYSYTDTLTGLHNRRYFDELLEHLAAQAKRRGHALTLIMIDIDHFKHFNDDFGHEAGDTVLAGVASCLAKHFREADVVCRLGGEEFAVLLTDADADAARGRVDALMARLAGTVYHYREATLGPISVSCGIASYPFHADEPLALIGLADKALYAAKHGGRARTHVYA